jgi:hypothetical protein
MLLGVPSIAQLHDLGWLATCQSVRNGARDPIRSSAQRVVNDMHITAGHRPT